MVTETSATDRPSRSEVNPTATPPTGSTSTPTAATSRDSDASNPPNRNGQRQNGRSSGAQRGGRGRGGKRSRDSGRKENKGSEEGSRIDWRDRKRRKVNQNGEDGAKSEPSYMSIQFPEAEIAAEERRPKRKVAVLIGYSGTGYHGLQINHDLKTIEGDLFGAFVAAKAISKANADDPRKSSFVRCARTDKGVHAAGNMVSLKLIIEDPDIVQKINDNLPPQIRVWGIQRTNNAFSCYASCDSRWYEYLMPSYCLLPPHPESFLGRKVLQSAKEKGLEDDYSKRMGDANGYWDEVDRNCIQPILDRLEPNIREAVKQRIHSPDRDSEEASTSRVDSTESGNKTDNDAAGETVTREAGTADIPAQDTPATDAGVITTTDVDDGKVAVESTADETPDSSSGEQPKAKEPSPVEKALKEVKAAYITAKRRYRVTPDRLEQLQEALDKYVGTKNYHNYTIQKSHSDPSSKRTIKSFVVNREPIQINDTQWLSLKVHGQSFMMHQIRKMVGMAVLAVRCATPWSRFEESYSTARISIPKAPSLGLLLERPVFDTYNKRATENLNLEALNFSNHEKDIQAFKEEHIYRRIFELEEKENSFHLFFNQIDTFKSDYFLWVTTGGLEIAKQREGPREPVPQELEAELGDEGEEAGDEEG
ncbi:hypothetical protein GQX73_g2543 [Xylaria multiplex]|uniref:tRNA pseudouridine synthase 1 n=1 Tax=Xylaria multiplex TaxID=323545 RepID=A0A7C8J0L1_9PEZI|nr:hypothetical protein GQX73_g2543 [Xylaria multiplex]